MGKRTGKKICPICGKEVFGLMKDEIGNWVCKSCFIEIYTTPKSSGYNGYTYTARMPEIQDTK